MEYSKADEFFFMVGAEKRAAARIWKRWRVNRFELNILAALSCYLQLQGKRIVSRKIFIHWLGLSYQLEHKANAYLYGLTKKGLCTRLAYRRADGHSLALSPYGVHILEEFYKEVDAIDQATRDRKKMPGFRSLTIDNNLLPRGYILLDPGRDN
jgi:hypothetical protein